MARAADVDPTADDDGDDDALSWAGDEEQGRAAPRLRQPAEDTPVAASAPDAEPDEAPGSLGRRAATVGFAIPYLILTIGWVLAVEQLGSGAIDVAYEVVWQFGEFLAMLSAPIWFAATLALTRGRRPLVRVGWLALGLAVLLPWPILLRFLAALFFVGSVS